MFLPQCLKRIRLNWKYSPYWNKFKTKSSLWTQLRQIIIIMWLLPSCTLLKILGPLCVEYNISFLNNFPFIKVQLSMILNHVLFCAIKQSIRSDQQSQTWGFYNHWVSNVLAFSCELRKVSSHSHFSGNFKTRCHNFRKASGKFDGWSSSPIFDLKLINWEIHSRGSSA